MNKTTDVIAQITALSHALTTSEEKIAAFVLDTPAKVTTMSVRDLADETGTSPATVSRFARTLGYSSYSDFRLAVAVSIGHTDPQRLGGQNVSMASVPSSLDFILQTKIAELTETSSLIDEDALRRVVEMMKQASQVFICGVGNTMTVAQNAAFKFNQAGVRATCPVTVESAISSSINLTNQDVVLMLSTSGLSKRLDVIADNAEDSDCPIIMVTDNPNTPLAQRANVVFRAISRDATFGRDVRFSQNSLNYLMEVFYLFLLTGWQDSVERNRILTKNLGDDRQL